MSGISNLAIPLEPESAAPDPDADSIITIDGYLVRESDGEVIGLADADIFTPDTPAKADWVLAKLARAEAIIAGLDAEEAAIRDNLRRLRRQQETRIRWLHVRFDGHLEQLAREQLAASGGRSKTYTLAHGSVSFRRVPESARVVDQERAVAFVEQCGRPDFIKVVKTVTAKDARDACQGAGWERMAIPGVEVTAEREAVKISTGVGKQTP